MLDLCVAVKGREGKERSKKGLVGGEVGGAVRGGRTVGRSHVEGLCQREFKGGKTRGVGGADGQGAGKNNKGDFVVGPDGSGSGKPEALT